MDLLTHQNKLQLFRISNYIVLYSDMYRVIPSESSVNKCNKINLENCTPQTLPG